MKTKRLEELYNNAKGDNTYYSFEDFKQDCKQFIKDIEKRNVICSMKVSSSGMTRYFNTLHYNMLLNIVYNHKFSWNSVKVGGCGMDMHWHLFFRACQDIIGRDEANNKYNSLCSSQPML